jgi:hypothetical protein
METGRRFAAPVNLGVSANFRQFPPARSLRLSSSICSILGFPAFPAFPPALLEIPLSKPVLGAQKGRRKSGWVGV